MANLHRYGADAEHTGESTSEKWKKRFAYFIVCVVAVTLYLTGALTFIERQFDDLKFGLLARPATQDVVLVEIDARSLSDFGVWPWPRRLHAIAARQLLEAGAAFV